MNTLTNPTFLILICISSIVFFSDKAAAETYIEAQKQPISIDSTKEEAHTKNDLINKKESVLEEYYLEKAGISLKQFGYEIFKPTNIIKNTVPIGSVEDDFILSIGDKIEIITRGQENSREIINIDSKGRIIIKNLPPIIAAGITIKELRKRIQIETTNLHNTDIYISLHEIKDIGVLIAGNVRKPGKRNIKKFSTILDALIQAEGITKNGTLRNIKLIRNGKTINIDFYDLLISGDTNNDHILMNGDRIIVPSINNTIAITGEVKNPSIYEVDIKDISTIKEILNLAGGTISRSNHRIIHSIPSNNGNNHIYEVKIDELEQMEDGSIIIVNKIKPKNQNSIEITGHSSRPGLYALDQTSKISNLFNEQDILGKDIYPLFAILERNSKDSLNKEYITISPSLIIAGKFNKKLHNRDKLHLFSNTDIKNALDKDIESTLHKNIERIILEHSISVNGAIRQNGKYPITENTLISELIKTSGGFSLNANKSAIELTRSNNEREIIDIFDEEEATINPGDSLRVNPQDNKYIKHDVIIMGEVKRPGTYNLIEGDNLLTLIERAGGLTENAYPNGTIFSRKSERVREEIRFKSKARELEIKLATLLSDKNNKPNYEQIKITKDLIEQLNSAEAIGRITVEASPASLKTHPEQNILLEPEDKIYIPKRPLTVRVAGEVHSPASLQFIKTKDFGDYIREAGGYSYGADKSRAFVVFPNGSATPAGSSYWSHTNLKIPPGSTIIVPHDPKPFNFLESAKDITKILTNLAVTGLLVDNIKAER